MFTTHSTNHRSWSVSWICDACRKSGWPVLRIVGYPTEEAWALVEEERAVIKGCLVDPSSDMEDHECPHCEVGVRVPPQYQEDL